MRVDELVKLRYLDLAGAQALVGEGVGRTPITGYGRLRGVEALTSRERAIQVVLRDDEVRLVYLGAAGLGELTAEDLEGRFGSGDTLRSRQGRRAWLHVVAPEGVAWSEQDGQLGFVELFPPTTLESYRSDIYEEPPSFRQ